MIEQYGAQILVYAAPNERDYNYQLRHLLPAHIQAMVFDRIDTASIRELAGLLSHCQLFVGNDTGPRHIAQALDIPLLTIVAPTGAKSIANPLNHPRFQAIDVWDVLGEQQKQRLLPTLKRDGSDQELFRQLTPEIVIPHIVSLIEEQCGRSIQIS